MSAFSTVHEYERKYSRQNVDRGARPSDEEIRAYYRAYNELHG